MHFVYNPFLCLWYSFFKEKINGLLTLVDHEALLIWEAGSSTDILTRKKSDVPIVSITVLGIYSNSATQSGMVPQDRMLERKAKRAPSSQFLPVKEGRTMVFRPQGNAAKRTAIVIRFLSEVNNGRSSPTAKGIAKRRMAVMI